MKTRVLLLIAFVFAAYGAMAQGGKSYFSVDELPNSVNFLPAPPTTTSSHFAYDRAQYVWGKRQRNTARGEQAKRNAIFNVDDMLEQFSGVFGYHLSRTETPAIYRLVANSFESFHDATRKAKQKYMRTRPYVMFNEPSLVPEDEEVLRHNGSYPSGHTSVGWGIALVLSELNPANQDEILALGYQWGQSRVIAGYHWQSDVDAARLVASACFARIHTSNDYFADMNAARQELELLKSK